LGRGEWRRNPDGGEIGRKKESIRNHGRGFMERNPCSTDHRPPSM
jgi:hypothetical protein